MFREIVLMMIVTGVVNFASPAAVVGRQDTPVVPPVVEEAVSGYYLDPAALGEGWAVRETEMLDDVDTSVFRVGVQHRLAGPHCARDGADLYPDRPRGVTEARLGGRGRHHGRVGGEPV